MYRVNVEHPWISRIQRLLPPPKHMRMRIPTHRVVVILVRHVLVLITQLVSDAVHLSIPQRSQHCLASPNVNMTFVGQMHLCSTEAKHYFEIRGLDSVTEQRLSTPIISIVENSAIYREIYDVTGPFNVKTSFEGNLPEKRTLSIYRQLPRRSSHDVPGAKRPRKQGPKRRSIYARARPRFKNAKSERPVRATSTCTGQ